MTIVLTGKQFHEKYKDKVFIKLTNEKEIHNGFRFQTGLNQDVIPFNPKGDCRPGGFYFTEVEKLPMWLNYTGEAMIYSRLVNLPDDAKVCEQTDKFKANIIVLGHIKKITGMHIWKDEKYCLEAVKKNPYTLEYIIEQTDKICLEAVKQNGEVLIEVNKQTPEICLAAVQQSGWALKFVKEKTQEICLAALKQTSSAFRFVDKQTRKMYLEARKQNK